MYALAVQRANCPRCRVGFLRIRVERRMRWSAKGGDGSGNSTEPFCRAEHNYRKGKKNSHTVTVTRASETKRREERRRKTQNADIFQYLTLTYLRLLYLVFGLEQEKLRFCRPEVYV
uniref:Uncharacterized protein n=1 Tax=Trichogramma kaykai TaxID=54128 RepID=A0ABD2WXK8_9HYME